MGQICEPLWMPQTIFCSAAARSPSSSGQGDSGARLRWVYSSFLRHSEVAAQKYDLKTVDILVELGKRRMVGGQEDLIVDVALDLLNDSHR